MRRDDIAQDASAQLRFSPRPRASAARSGSCSCIGIGRVRRERRRPARDARQRGGVRHRVPERRSLQRRATPAPTSSCRAVPDRAGRRSLPVGGYDFDNVRARLQPRAAAADLGQRCSPSTARSTTATRRRFGVEQRPRRTSRRSSPSSRPTRSTGSTSCEGSFTTHLAGSRVTYTMTPLMFVSALLQYNSSNHAIVGQRAAALGVPARQRAVRRLQRGARHAGARGFPTSRTARSSSRSTGCSASKATPNSRSPTPRGSRGLTAPALRTRIRPTRRSVAAFRPRGPWKLGVWSRESGSSSISAPTGPSTSTRGASSSSFEESSIRPRQRSRTPSRSSSACRSSGSSWSKTGRAR